MSDPARLSMWRKFKKGLCDGCWAGCCTLPVEVDFDDLLRLELVTESEREESPKKILKCLKAQKWVESFQPKTGKYVLAQRAGRDCVYLDEKTRLCTVYDRRPNVCRGFPETLGPRPGFCPAKPR